MTSRQANQAIKEATKQGKNTYLPSPTGFGIRVYRVRVKDGISQARALSSGVWFDLGSFSDLYHQ